jgi:putative sterol carrier protein
MATVISTTLDALMTDLEGLWQRFDQLFDSLGPGDWSRKHGKHWTFADVPYHLAYFDREMIATPIERGRNVPAEEQRPMRTVAEMNAWNEARFAQRPANQTPQQSLEQMQASRQAIRRAVAQLSDAEVNFTGVMDITGPGGAAWAIQVAHGTCCVSEERPAHADLVMTQSPETFVKTLAEMHNPMIAMLTGKIKVRGFRNLGTFGKLFHPPALNQPLDYNPTPIETLK